MSSESLGRWPVTIEVPVAWGDVDAIGHVNNVVYLRWFESARIAYWERVAETHRIHELGPILARQEIDYKLPLRYPDRVRASVTVTKLGRTSFTMGYRIHSVTLGAVAAEGQGVCVMFDYQRGEKIPIPDDLRSAVLALEAAA